MQSLRIGRTWSRDTGLNVTAQYESTAYEVISVIGSHAKLRKRKFLSLEAGQERQMVSNKSEKQRVNQKKVSLKEILTQYILFDFILESQDNA